MTGWRNRAFLLRAAALLVLLGGFLLPSVTIVRPVYTVTAVLDITLSMNVRDQTMDGRAESRIAAEKRAAAQLLAQLPCGSRFGLAIFVERQPFLLFEPVEVCENQAVLAREIAAVDWRMGWDSESHIAEGVLAALRLARTADSDLVFMTDGQETPPVSWEAPPDFSSLRGNVHGLLVGVGGRNFAPIPKFDTFGREIGTYQPGDVPSETAGLFRGREHLSAQDEPHLRALAVQSGLTYLGLGTGTELSSAYLDAARPRRLGERVRIMWVAGGLALLLVGAGMLPDGRGV